MQLIILDADYQFEMNSPQRRNIIHFFWNRMYWIVNQYTIPGLCCIAVYWCCTRHVLCAVCSISLIACDAMIASTVDWTFESCAWRFVVRSANWTFFPSVSATSIYVSSTKRNKKRTKRGLSLQSEYYTDSQDTLWNIRDLCIFFMRFRR